MDSFLKFLKEINAAGAGGVFGVGSSADFSISSGDTYAPGDARVPKFLGAYSRKGKIKTKRKRKKSK